MDIKAFLKLLNRYKWILIIIPVVTAAITYPLVKSLPKTYKAEAQIATGLVDQSKQVAGTPEADWFKTAQQFSSIIEKIKMRKIISILSYQLILHDLANPSAPFKKISDKIDSLSVEDKQKVVALYQQKLASKEISNPADNKGTYPLYDYIASMEYDQNSLMKVLEISHEENSDFINIRYTSDNPFMAAFVVNTLATEFIANYGKDVNFNQTQSITVLDSLLKGKERDMNSKNAALKEFKMRNGVLNLDKQSELVYQQITMAEDRKSKVISDIQAGQGALAAIDNRLRSTDPNMGRSVPADNAQVINLKNQLEIANKRYIDNNFNPDDKRRVDSLTTLQAALTSRNSDKFLVDPAITRQNLLTQKYNLETNVAQLSGSVKSIDAELATARAKYNKMVPFDAGIQNYLRDADMATKDYLDALNRVTQTQTEQNIGLKLQIAQVGLPGIAEPSKTLVFVILSSIASFFICLVVLIILFLSDTSINTTYQLAAATKSKVFGSLNLLPRSDRSITSIWNEKDVDPNNIIHKELLRSLRFEINTLMSEDDSRVLGITSLTAGEGKTFVASNLAYAYAMTGKKVLLVGGEDSQPALSSSKQLAISQNFENFLVNREIRVDDLITKLSKVEQNKSLFEIQNEKNLRSGFDVLKKQFDIIIIDIDSMANINMAKEWLSFTEKNFAVFEAGKSLMEGDKDMINFLKSQHGFMGWVINKVRLTEIKG